MDGCFIVPLLFSYKHSQCCCVQYTMLICMNFIVTYNNEKNKYFFLSLTLLYVPCAANQRRFDGNFED